MASVEKDLEKLTAEQAKEDADFLAFLERETKEFDKASRLKPHLFPTPTDEKRKHDQQDSEIERVMKAFKANPYDVLDLQPGVPDEDIKKTYRRKSLLIHPDKTKNEYAKDAFDRLAKAYQALLDEKAREELDEAIADARTLLLRERKLTVDSEEARDPDTEFVKGWKEKIKFVLNDNEARRQRQHRAQMQEEGRAKRKEEAEIAERKRKREQEQEWERTRDERIGSWRNFQQKGNKASDDAAAGGKKKKAKLKTLG